MGEPNKLRRSAQVCARFMPFHLPTIFYQLIRLRISFICSRRRGRTVARIKKWLVDIHIQPPKQMSWYTSRDAKIPSSPHARALPRETHTRTVNSMRTCARDTFGARKYTRTGVRSRPNKRAWSKVHAAIATDPHATRRRPPAATRLPALPSAVGRRVVEDLVDGVDGELQEAEDRVENRRPARRRCPPKKETMPWIRVL